MCDGSTAVHVTDLHATENFNPADVTVRTYLQKKVMNGGSVALVIPKV